jgi:hypothetical protein
LLLQLRTVQSILFLYLELRVLQLLSRHSTTWPTTLALFALVIFQIWSHHHPPICFLCSWDDRHTPPHSAFIGLANCLSRLTLTTLILLISTLQVAKITDTSHHTQSKVFFYFISLILHSFYFSRKSKSDIHRFYLF